MALNTVRAPIITDQLLEYLTSVFPDEVVDPLREDPATRFGNAQVIRHLRSVQQSQEEDGNVST